MEWRHDGQGVLWLSVVDGWVVGLYSAGIHTVYPTPTTPQHTVGFIPALPPHWDSWCHTHTLWTLVGQVPRFLAGAHPLPIVGVPSADNSSYSFPTHTLPGLTTPADYAPHTYTPCRAHTHLRPTLPHCPIPPPVPRIPCSLYPTRALYTCLCHSYAGVLYRVAPHYTPPFTVMPPTPFGECHSVYCWICVALHTTSPHTFPSCPHVDGSHLAPPVASLAPLHTPWII